MACTPRHTCRTQPDFRLVLVLRRGGTCTCPGSATTLCRRGPDLKEDLQDVLCWQVLALCMLLGDQVHQATILQHSMPWQPQAGRRALQPLEHMRDAAGQLS